MTGNKEIITRIQKAFAAEPRPEHFTNHLHCCECAAHDELLRSRDRQSLRIEDVNNPGWDPVCYLTVEGWRYYLPALVRLVLESAGGENEWYLPQLLFHLIGDGQGNRRLESCSDTQQKAIAAFLWYIVETEVHLITYYNIDDTLQTAIEIWSTSPS